MLAAVTVDAMLLFPDGVPPPLLLRGYDPPLLRPLPGERNAARVADAETLDGVTVVGKLDSEAPVADRSPFFRLQLLDGFAGQAAIEIRVVYSSGLGIVLD